MKLGILCMVSLVTWVQGASIAREKHDIEKRMAFDMVNYLERYGYLPSSEREPEDDEEIFHSYEVLEFALGKFQEFNGLPITGRMDKETYELMQKPRCGYKDIPDESDPNQPLSYTLSGRKWPKTDITWKTVKWTNKLPQSEQRRAMENAFKYWSEVTPLTFTYTEGTPDIEVKFARGEHGDGWANAFDGKGNTLAHAFGPGSQSISGDTHFDNDEDWTYHESRGSELQTVAAHEFGHAIGLGHSRVHGSLMAPYYQGYDPDFKLHPDDIRGAQLLYGSKPGKPTTTPVPTTTTTEITTTTTETNKPYPDVCSIKLDAIVTASDGFFYAFRNDMVYKIHRNLGLVVGYPKLIWSVYPGAPPKIRGAFYMAREEKTYLFKDTRLWRYTRFELDNGFPKNIPTNNFPEILHAVMTMSDSRGNTRVFMFGSKMFWEWSPDTLERMDLSLNIDRYWSGIPRGVEAAVTGYDGNMYFFKGKKFRKFNPLYRWVEAGYPKRWAPIWMRNVCADTKEA